MKLTKDKYIVSRATVEKLLYALEKNRIAFNGEDDYNNDEIIEAQELLEDEINPQELGI